ncbi:MAG: hypothetical protein IJS96_09495 [Schwartzia sp.]|nr:hypothetical protein [Schwartzia sp. (in: firmicutes)]
MRNAFAGCLLIFAMLTFAGCGNAAPPSAAPASETAPPAAGQPASSGRREETATETQRHLEIHIGEKVFHAVLEDTAAAKAFSAKLPLSVEMTELNGNEKYYRLDEKLPSDDVAIGEIHAGDLMLFDSSYIVLFYRDFSTNYRYTRLGRLNDPEGLSLAVGKGTVFVTMHR